MSERTLLLGLIGIFILLRSGSDRATAFFASMPGGASEMVVAGSRRPPCSTSAGRSSAAVARAWRKRLRNHMAEPPVAALSSLVSRSRANNSNGLPLKPSAGG